MRDKIMSTQHSQNKNTIKKIKLDEVDKDVNSVAEYKKSAILKYCNENGIEKNQFDILSVTNEHNKLGIFIVFTQYLLDI